MSKKVIVTAIITSIICILLVFGVVIGANYLGNSSGNGSHKPTGTNSEPHGSALEYGEKEFLNDPNFLDEYQPYATVEKSEGLPNVYSMLVSSVKNDMRITILDENGQAVTGIPFIVNLKDTGEYKDIDLDGIIYIGGLKAGKYEVSLKEDKDYKSESNVAISVHDSLEYNELKDISYLIKTEDEIDALAEDTFTSTADTDATQETEMWKRKEEATLGIDVSKWNKEIDWELVKESGIDFAIIRCGYRGSKTGALVEDPYFAKNIKGAKAAGVKVGIYFFTQALNETEAVEEASTALALLNGEKLDYPIFIDTESSGGRADGIDVDTRTAVCDAFCKTIEKNGYKSGVYASRSWFYNKVNDDKLSQYIRWLAEYRKEPLYTGKYEIWQYTSKGSVPGIEGRVDLNQSYLSVIGE